VCRESICWRDILLGAHLGLLNCRATFAGGFHSKKPEKDVGTLKMKGETLGDFAFEHRG
jgi:hypothetical protein